MHRVVSDYTRVDDANSNIKVFVRARPVEQEGDLTDFLQTDGDDERKLVIKDPEASNKRYGEVSFQFDKVFWTNTKQEDVFDISCRSQVDHVMNGYNSCCFAYGQTGSGKTYTMFGEGTGEVRGVIPRSVEYLFQCLAKKTSSSEVAMVCSFLEIYNDQIRDLGKAYLAAMGVESNTSAALHEKTSDLFEKLAGKRGNPYFAPAFHKSGSAMALSGAVRPGLKEVQDEYNTMNYEIREDNEGNVFVKDLSLVPVTTMEEVMSLIATGLRVRATHETKMNAFSSRSHTVFTITVLQRDKYTGEAITGMLNLVDLAGSERLKKSESIGVRLKEALHINTSLTALGKVIMALDPSSENSHVPYRDSKLTRVLQNSLGGNSFTTVIATVHPVAKFYEECLSSLQFANRCRNVRNNPRVNYVEDTEDKDRKIRKLMEEIGTLRTKMTQLTGNDLAGGMRAGGGGSVAGSGKLSAAALVQLLKRLGIAASLTPEGALLVNGQKFGADDIGLGEGSADMGGGDGRVKDGGNSVNTEKLMKSIKELKEANANHSAKSKERKLQMEEQGRQLQKMSVEIVKLQTGMRHKEFECKTLAEEKERALSEMKQFLEQKYAGDLQGMINHNREMLNHHQEEFNKIPAALMEYTKLAAKTDKERNDYETPLKAEFETTLKGIDKSRLSEQAHVKSQYDFWLEEKDMALSGFVDSFNAYRAKKSEQLRMAEREIVKLYDYFEQLEAVIQGACDGKFLVRIKEPGFAIPESRFGSTDMDNVENGVKGAVIIPKAFVPLNPFKAKGETRLELTLKIVGKHKERTERLRKMKTDALAKSVHYAKASTKTVEEGSLVGNVRNFLATRPITPPEKLQVVSGVVFHAPGHVRPQSAGAQAVKELPTNVPKLPPARASSAAANKQLNGTGGLGRSRELTVQRSPGRVQPGSQLDLKYRGGDLVSTAPGELQSRPSSWHEDDGRSSSPGENKASKILALEKKNRELANEIERMREREKQSQLQAAELGTKETADYIRNLEGESERLKKLVKDINAQLHASKVAQNALTRKFGRGYDSNEENDGVF